MNLNDLRIAWDCDGTLIHDHNDGELNGKPRYIVIELFHILENLGADMYIWSGGGKRHAQEVKDSLGLEATVVEKGSFKPEIAVDNNKDLKLGKVDFNVNGQNDDLKVMFDVNGTLIYDGDPDYLDDEGEPLDGSPRYSVIELFEYFKNFGVNLYIWSSEGQEFAQSWKDRLGLTGAEVVEKSKDFGADIAVDNNDFNLARVTIPV
jgi:hypothetical protein